MQPGVFTISLDFELFWGVRDHRTIGNYGKNIAAVHQVVPGLLKRFTAYGVHATWATVGFLFAGSKEDLLLQLPGVLPQYDNRDLDPYAYLHAHSLDPVYHFAPGLIAQIAGTAGQEMATHTHSHFYTLESGASPDAFEADIAAAVKLAGERGYQLTSIIFPRNQYSAVHLAICRKHGISCYRGTEANWVYGTRSRESETKLRRAIRLADAYINLTGHHAATPVREEGGMVNVPASRFLRPYSRKLAFLEGWRLARIKGGMTAAAKRGLVYHLWWHPHNFGANTEANFAALEVLLKHYKTLQDRYGMTSLNMNEIYQRTA